MLCSRLVFILVLACLSAGSSVGQCVVSLSTTCPPISQGGVTISNFSASNPIPVSLVASTNMAFVLSFDTNIVLCTSVYPSPNSCSAFPNLGPGPVHEQITFSATASPSLKVYFSGGGGCVPGTIFSITVTGGNSLSATGLDCNSPTSPFLPNAVISPFLGGTVLIDINLSFGPLNPSAGITGASVSLEPLIVYFENAGVCGDERDTIIAEYTQHNNAAFALGIRPFDPAPSCNMFTQTQPNFNINNDTSYELVRDPLTNAGTGLTVWEGYYGAPLIITSSYRSPNHNASIPGARGSRHVFGDAIDVSNPPQPIRALQEANWQALYNAAQVAGADWLEDRLSTYQCRCTPTRCDCVHADWRDTPGPYIQ